jgi:hypothetical protein
VLLLQQEEEEELVRRVVRTMKRMNASEVHPPIGRISHDAIQMIRESEMR